MYTTKTIILWMPRVLTILFAAFISLFALDVFNEGYGFWKTVGALLIHLVPTFLLIGLLLISWKREWIAGIIHNCCSLYGCMVLQKKK